MDQLVGAARTRLRLRSHVVGRPAIGRTQGDCSDPEGVVESAGASVHIDLNQLVETLDVNSDIATGIWSDCRNIKSLVVPNRA